MKIFVTGSESFVGKELIAQCLRAGISVAGMDLLDAPSQNYDYRKGDIKSSEVPGFILENADVIVHLAALSRDPDCRNRAYECFETNVMGTLNMMRAATQKKAKQLIFASSEWVYDKFEGGKEKDEEAFIDIAGHTSEYALSKLVSEANLREQYDRGFCAATVLRFGIIYGPRKNNWSAVETLASAVKNGGEVEVGSQKSGRRFVHIEDIARGIMKSFDLAGFNIINLTGDRVYTLGDVIKTSEKVFGKKVVVKENDANNVSVRNPSNAKAKKVLDWRPEIDLEAGIKTLINFV